MNEERAKYASDGGVTAQAAVTPMAKRDGCMSIRTPNGGRDGSVGPNQNLTNSQMSPRDKKNSFLFTVQNSGPGTQNLGKTQQNQVEAKGPKLKYFSTGPFIIERDFNR